MDRREQRIEGVGGSFPASDAPLFCRCWCRTSRSVSQT